MAITFLIVSAFAQRIPVAIFNFVAPYNFSATYGMALAIWSVLLLVRHARSGKPATLAASAALAGLVALTKMETTFAVVVAHGAFLATVLPRPSRARVIAWGCGLAVTAVGYLVAAHLSQGHVWAPWWSSSTGAPASTSRPRWASGRSASPCCSSWLRCSAGRW